MKHTRRLAAFLAALVAAVALTATPAMATQGETPPAYTDIPQENTSSETVSSQAPVEEPTPAPELPTPEPPVSSDPPSSSEDPGSSLPSDPWEGESSQEPGGDVSSDPWAEPTEEPSSSYVEEPVEEPTEEPTEEPWWPSESQTEDPYAGTTSQDTTSSASEPETIATPRPSLERPQITLNTGNTDDDQEEEESSGPNYVTFAQLNLRGNSMAVTLFYSGVGSIAVGVIGLITILVLYVRGRRRYSQAEGILEEIHEAEARQRPAQQPPQPPIPEAEAPQPPAAPQPPVRQAPPGAIMPEEVSLYTEEFSLPSQEEYAPGYDDEYESEYDQQGYGPADDQDLYYDDDYYDEGDEYEYEPEPEPYVPPRQPEPPRSQPAPSADQEATRQFDTEEILREALRYTDEDFR